MGNQPDNPFRIEVTLGANADISAVEDNFSWGNDEECQFILRSPNGDEMVFYGDLDTSIEAMEYLKEFGLVPGDT